MANVTLWEGKLLAKPIEFGPADSYSIDGRQAFTVWQAGDIIALLRKFAGRTVRISIEEVEIMDD